MRFNSKPKKDKRKRGILTLKMEEAAITLLETLTSQNSIKIEEESSQKLEHRIYEYIQFLPGSITIDGHTNNGYEDKIDQLYGRIINALHPIFEINIPFESKNLQLQLENLLIVEGSNFHMLYETLIFSLEFLKKSQNEKSVEFIVIVLGRILKSDALFSSIISACEQKNMTKIEAEACETKFKNFIQILVSLPIKISNKLRGRIPATFQLDNFSRIIAFHVARAISFAYKRLNEQKIHSDVRKISIIISKILLNLRSENFSELAEILICLSLENEDGMAQIIQDILLKIERQSIESMAILLLKNINNPTDVEKIFGNILKDNNWEYILTTKIMFFSYYKDDKLIINLVTYLSRQWSRTLFIELIMKLLDIWGDKSALNHTSFDQHEFITKFIVLSIDKISAKLKPLEKDSIQKLLFSGIAAHLEDMQGNIRALGMITGELIVDCLNEPDAPKLKYDYTSMPEEDRSIIRKFEEFCLNKYESCKSSPSRNIKYGELIENLKIKAKISSKFEEKGKKKKQGFEQYNEEKSAKYEKQADLKSKVAETANSKIKDRVAIGLRDNDTESSLDSDDDLIPYNMSNDTKICENSRPMYLRDLKENLTNFITNNDPDIFSESLRCSDNLIISQLPNNDASFAVELLTLFSKLPQTFYVENFFSLKFRACVSIIKIYPKESAEFLCKEFHSNIASNSVSDRLFFLNILGEAAKELSKLNVNEVNSKKGKESKNLKSYNRKLHSQPISLFLSLEIGKKIETLYDDDFELSSNLELQNWAADDNIQTQRIESNTRVFTHTSKCPRTTFNKFNDVVSYFFYPLLYGLHVEEKNIFLVPKHFEDQANILLINFLKTLCTIMLAAENCVIAPKMGRDMLELSWNLRYHREAEVRCCVIESIAAVVIAVPKHYFTTEIIELLLELRMWLEDISQETIKGDPSAKCREIGRSVISLIDYDSTPVVTSL